MKILGRLLVLVAAIGLVMGGCKKKEEKKQPMADTVKQAKDDAQKAADEAKK